MVRRVLEEEDQNARAAVTDVKRVVGRRLGFVVRGAARATTGHTTRGISEQETAAPQAFRYILW